MIWLSQFSQQPVASTYVEAARKASSFANGGVPFGGRLVAGVLAVALTLLGPIAAQAELLVSDNFGSQILRFDVKTGSLIGTLVAPKSGGLDGATGMRIGPDGLLWVTSQNNNSILRYNLEDGSPAAPFATAAIENNGRLAAPAEIVFRNNEVLVSNFGGNSIERFNPVTGESLGNFLKGTAPTQSSAFVFGPDDHLYVSSFGTAEVLRYDASGNFVSALPKNAALNGPASLAFKDGRLYVSSLLGQQVLRYNAELTESSVFASPAAPGGFQPFPSDLLFLPDRLLVTLTGQAGVAGFDLNTGAQQQYFLTGGGLQVPGRMLLLPTTRPGDANLDGRVDLSDFVVLRNNFGKAGKRAQGDFSLDGNVELADFIVLRNNFGLAASPVPEPAALAAVLLLVVAGRVMVGRHNARAAA